MRRLVKIETGIVSNIDAALQLLRDNRIAEVIYRFQGNGDDGGIDSVEYIDENGDPIHDAATKMAAHYILVSEFTSWVTSTKKLVLHPVLTHLQDHVEDIARKFPDWVNGAGGHGSVSVNVNERSWYGMYTVYEFSPASFQLSAKDVACIRAAVGETVWTGWVAEVKKLPRVQSFLFYWYNLPPADRDKFDEAVDTILATRKSANMDDLKEGTLCIGYGGKCERLALYWQYSVRHEVNGTRSDFFLVDEEDTDASA